MSAILCYYMQGTFFKLLLIRPLTLLTQMNDKYGVPLHRISTTFEYFSRPLSKGSIRWRLCAELRFRWTVWIFWTASQTSRGPLVDAKVCLCSWDSDSWNFLKASAIIVVGSAMIKRRGVLSSKRVKVWKIEEGENFEGEQQCQRC